MAIFLNVLILNNSKVLAIISIYKHQIMCFSEGFKGAAPRFSSEDKESLLSEILRSCRN
jgi:hypothetical protein